MPRAGMLTFPDFKGFTKTLVLWNLGIFFVLLLLGVAAPAVAGEIIGLTALSRRWCCTAMCGSW